MSTDVIVECVPNFSEGRDRAVIDAIAESMSRIEGASLLDVDPGAGTNRTVMTVVGPPESVLEAAFHGIATAARLIDMTRHSGAHPRMGATDVCPFVPVRGIDMEGCAELARRLGERVGAELGIPVFLYEFAAARPERRNLANIRSGEYEGMAEKLTRPEWRPDFGPAVMSPQSGVTAIGARKFLLAYNVNLNSRSKKVATEIALEIREQGRNKRGSDGKFIRDADGTPVKVPGRLEHVKAVGWYIDEYARAQISCNLTDHDVSGLHDVFDACLEEGQKIGVRVTGSEIVGLVPLEAMLRAGRHYLRRQGESTGVPEGRLIEAAVTSLGLAELTPFDPDDKIIEYRLRGTGRTLRDLPLSRFMDELSSESPAPGGGSVAAALGALSAALTSMVGNLTTGKKGLEQAWAEAEGLAVAAQEAKDWYLVAIDRDTAAFESLMAAFRLPKGTSEEKQVAKLALGTAQWGALEVPMQVLGRTTELCSLAAAILAIGNTHAASDAACAAACAAATAECAHFNVLINLATFEDPRAATLRQEADSLLATTRDRAASVMQRFREGF